jgi:hypothetical protein
VSSWPTAKPTWPPDLEAEVVVAEKTDQGPNRKPGLEGKGRIIPRCRLVHRGLDPGPGVVQEHGGRVHRQAVEAVGRRASEAQELRGQVRLRHADQRNGICEG